MTQISDPTLKFSWLFKLFLWLIPLGVFVWLLRQNVVPGGQMEIVYDFKKDSPIISRLVPTSRVSDIKKDARPFRTEEDTNWYQEILEEPVYFDVRLQRSFDSAEVEVKYKNLETPVFEMGVSVDTSRKQFQFKPLENKALESLEWDKIREGDAVLYQRTPKYKSIQEFLNNLPKNKEIAVYHYDLPYTFRAPFSALCAEGACVRRVWDVPLQGPHRFYAYAESEPLDFAFKLRNLGAGEKVRIRIYQEQEEVYSKEFENTNLVEVSVPALFQGAYPLKSKTSNRAFRAEIDAPSQLVIEQIKTNARYLAFINHLRLGELNQPDALYTNGYKFLAKTEDYRGVQGLKINNTAWSIPLPYEKYQKSVEQGSGLVKILIPKGHLTLETGGLFSFDPQSFFDPGYRKFEPDLNLDSWGINYILAEYAEPGMINNNYKIVRAKFDLTKVATPNRKVRFLFSLPEWQKNGGSAVDIYQIKIGLKGEPITPRLFLAKLWRLAKRQLGGS